jgi:hypothetical protein
LVRQHHHRNTEGMCPSTRHPTRSGPQRSEETRSGGPLRGAACYRSGGWATDHRNTPQASWWIGRRGLSDSGRPREAVPSAAWAAAGGVTSWLCVWLLGRRWGLRGSGSALVVADRGCATRELRRGGRRVGVLRRPPTS